MTQSNIHKGMISFMALTSLTGAQAKENDSKKPNVIVILADDLGFGDISLYGSKTIKTPCIDALANSGLRFNQGFCTSATSTPSRYALLTGMYPWRKQVNILPGDAPLIISETQPTLPKLFRQAGYSTGVVGKWHLGLGNGTIDWNETIKPSPFEIGFDYSYIMGATNDRVPCVYVENGKVDNLDPNDPISVSYKSNFEGEPTGAKNPELLKMYPSHGHNMSIVNGISRIGFMKGGKSALWKDETMASVFLDKVKSFIAENKEKPFFLYYGLNQPHVPRAPHSDFVGKSGMGPRGDAILEADWCIGQLTSYLQSMGLADNTIIIFSSDNGPVLDDGYQDQAQELADQHNHKPAGPYRGGKYSLFEGGTHVPFIISWPKEIPAGKTTDAMVCQMDLLASFASFLGEDIPKDLDSENLMNAFLGKSKKGRTSLVTEATGRLALKEGDYLMIPPHNGVATDPNTKSELGNDKGYQLYNTKKDPAEQHNLVVDNGKLLEKMKKSFIQQSAVK
ncbi:MAG: arylsulfatase [Bacteroidales bacterium]|nr:arylsulfatase [Bacteroidales bacterium]MDD4823393.1 arylsulfatase [Bacteroidales bacterium]